jgi:hypothetical protein
MTVVLPAVVSKGRNLIDRDSMGVLFKYTSLFIKQQVQPAGQGRDRGPKTRLLSTDLPPKALACSAQTFR